MVSVVENDCVVSQASVCNFFQILTDQCVHHGQTVVVLSPVFADFRCVRVIGSDASLGRIVNHVFGIDLVSDLTFVTDLYD